MKREPTPLQDTFGAVRAMVAAHVPPLRVLRDVATDYEVAAAAADSHGDLQAFARVHLGAGVVTLELPVVARDPDLLTQIGPSLSACRGGTSDFTFAAPDARIFEDIARLLDACTQPHRPKRRH